MSLPHHRPLVDLSMLDHNGRLGNDQIPPDAARALMALDASRMGSWSHHVPEDEIWGDHIVADLLGFDFDAQPWCSADFYEMVHPDDRERVGRAVADAYEGHVPFYDLQLRRKPAAASENPDDVLWIGGRAQVTERDSAGNPLRVIGVNWDVTETKRVEEQLALLAAEMDHRVKNAFAVIRALINIGQENTQDLDTFAATLRTQVEAMATAHTLSARMARSGSDATAKVAMSEIIETALSPWLHSTGDLSATHVKIDCDPDILLSPIKVAAFAMMLYELSTNATKYGPLGTQGGGLYVSVERRPDGAIHMFWTETLKDRLYFDPAAEAKRGFGKVLLDHCANNLNATIKRELTASGFQLEMTMAAPAR